MKIIIEIIPHKDQRYPTVGDWQWDALGNLQIKVSNMNNWKYEFLVARHELDEAMLCRERGVSEQDVSDFDMEFEATRLEDDTSEPGDHPLAPYRTEHFVATTYERLMASELGIDWMEYDKTISKL